MDILLYNSDHGELETRLKQNMPSIEALCSVEKCRELSWLMRCFREPGSLPEAIVLVARDREELQAFTNLASRLEQLFVILVLPDAGEETIALGHSLCPRFITYHDSDFQDVVAVLTRIAARKSREQPGSGGELEERL
ncbi:hypothetical protein [Desulfogranum mediterraneum]|uniref:hypothetical protein n=1 Tax=Desulfogranum mediterraneum TaxID=160661 RepID=UPI0004294ACB|nr:hypothetical protein [Desulfogranum mediterraneum]